jgi:hypothetical protein
MQPRRNQASAILPPGQARFHRPGQSQAYAPPTKVPRRSCRRPCLTQLNLPPGKPEAPWGHTLAGAPRKYPHGDPMTGKLPGPPRDRDDPIMEMRVALLRAGGLSVYRIALALTVRRQSVDHVLRRPHVAAQVEHFRNGLRTHWVVAG